MDKEEYINLLEENLARARQQVLILEARCAILENRRQDVPASTLPARLALSSSAHPVHRHESTFTFQSRTSQRSHIWLHGSTSQGAPPSSQAAPSRYFSGRLLSSHRRSVSFADEPQFYPVKRVMPSSAQSLPRPVIKPYLDGNHPPSDPCGDVQSTHRYLSRDHPVSRTSAEASATSRNYISAIQSLRHPATMIVQSPQATSICTPGPTKYLRSRRRFGGRQSLGI